MKHLTCWQLRLMIVMMTVDVCLLPTDAFAAAGGCPSSAEEAISGALGNVRSRYRGKLSRYGLTESYFDETSGICDLMLLDVKSWTKYQIVYYRAAGQIEWPRMMPKSVAEDLMQDRLIIHQYECSLGKGKAEASTPRRQSSEVESKAFPRKQQEYKPLNEDCVPTSEAQAAEDAAIRDARAAAEEGAALRKKGDLNKLSDLRQMAELKRNGMSGDEIASRFGIDRVKEYNKAHPNSPIRTSQRSKPGAPGFKW